MKTKKKNATVEMALFLESSRSTYEIKDQDGKTVSLQEARRRWEAGELQNWNMSFARLAQHGFDLEATKAYYEREAARLKPQPPEAA